MMCLVFHYAYISIHNIIWPLVHHFLPWHWLNWHCGRQLAGVLLEAILSLGQKLFKWMPGMLGKLHKYIPVNPNCLYYQHKLLPDWSQNTHGHPKPSDIMVNILKEKLDSKKSGLNTLKSKYLTFENFIEVYAHVFTLLCPSFGPWKGPKSLKGPKNSVS